MQETIGFSGTLSNLDATWLCNKRRALSPIYAAAEFFWYMSRERSINMLLPYAPQYYKFAENDIAHGAYGDRLVRNTGGKQDQLTTIAAMLRSKPNTRQAVVTLWDCREDLLTAVNGLAKDIPCTLSWQFLLRDSYLHMVCTMRSEDVWLGMPYDVFVNTAIQRLLADELNVRAGSYTHNVGSLHLYARNQTAAQEAMQETGDSHFTVWDQPTTFDDANKALLLVRQFHACSPPVEELPNRSKMSDDFLWCIAQHWNPGAFSYERISTSSLYRGMEVYLAHRGRK